MMGDPVSDPKEHICGACGSSERTYMLHMREFNLNLGKELHHLGDCIVVPQDLLQRGPMRGPRLLNTAHIHI